ncbi:MAG TPA: thiamine pyrophosphate-binding protein [Candidatus Angelobacter sp.]|nr:thiamine pyrophosphate-binding protein [Candidatus Angelobacter sp.]
MASTTPTQQANRIRIAGNRTGAWLARYALEQLPISHTFGIPGVHTTELYDELAQSEKITPVLPTHECCGAFAADAISRTTGNRIGCLVIVPAAGVTHAMSGIGECYLDGIPLLVITGGPRTDLKFGYQLHGIDQQRLVDGIVKRSWKVLEHRDIVPVIFEAYRAAVSGVPGPVLVEIPVNLQLFSQRVDDVPVFIPYAPQPASVDREIDAAVELLCAAKSPGIFTGWGAVDASVVDSVIRIAEILGAPVSTTLQGISAFPGNHALHAGMGFSRAAVPAAEKAFAGCDCLLAIGVSFGEIPTGSFGCPVPENLIHIDISPQAIGRNFPAKVGLVGDSRLIVPRLLARLEARATEQRTRRLEVAARIARDKNAYSAEWHAHTTDRVNPALFFEELRRQLRDDAIMTVDDGNHTFLAAELYEVRAPRTFVSPTDFNSMGYAVPAAIGAKLANPDRQVVSIVGDGAFLMTGLETITAVTLGLEIAYFVFDDGELSQISQGQEIPYNRKSCTELGDMRLKGVADAVGARFVTIENNAQIADVIREALTPGQKKPVIVDVHIDYSKRTRFTQGVVKTAMKTFPFRDKARFILRALVRKVTG